MISAPLPELEDERLAELYSYNILDSPPEDDFSDIVELASFICNVPMSHISFIEKNRSWHKARIGLEGQEVDRNLTFCSHTICGNQPLVVPDASKDARFAGNPFVLEDPAIRFYAGFPLVTSNGNSVGTLCVVDTTPRALNERQLHALDILSKQVIKLLDERLRSMQLQQTARLEQQRNARLQQLISTQRRIMAILGHDTRGPLFYINWMIRSMIKNNIVEGEMQNNFEIISNQLDSTLIMIEDLLDWSRVNILNAETDQHLFAVREMTDELLETVQVVAGKKSIQLINEVQESMISRCHERIIRFVTRNLLVNAIKFTQQGSVKISAVSDKEWLRIIISDTGIGMSEARVQQYLKGELTSTRGTNNEQGSGLGLLLIHEFLQQVNGKIEVNSVPGQGTTVMLTFPCYIH